jgi:hypothetical protein
MSPDRWAELEAEFGQLTKKEMRQGWHFGPDFDFLLTQGEQVDEQERCAFCGFDRRKVK